MEHLDLRHRRWLSTGAIAAGTLILVVVFLWFAYDAFCSWLDGQDLYLASEQTLSFGIPPITPTPTATITPTPQPTPTVTPTPMPAVRIIIPKIGVNQQIVETGLIPVGSGPDSDYMWDTAKYAVGHRQDSARPGQVGNIVLSGHNNVYGQVFRDLDKLAPGDPIHLYTLDQEFVYTVVEKHFVLAVGVREEDVAQHAQHTAWTPEETLTLVSCWPYATYTHRIYVIAKPDPSAAVQ